jgi:hypothetical protein
MADLVQETIVSQKLGDSFGSFSITLCCNASCQRVFGFRQSFGFCCCIDVFSGDYLLNFLFAHGSG